jgi:hypothetical protein
MLDAGYSLPRIRLHKRVRLLGRWVNKGSQMGKGGLLKPPFIWLLGQWAAVGSLGVVVRTEQAMLVGRGVACMGPNFT